MFAANVVCHPWDLEDEGIDRVLDRLAGELGAGGVTYLAAGPARRLLRRHRNVSPRVFQSDGGFYFQPSDPHYHSTRIKPVVSAWLRSRDPLAKVAAGCRQRKLDLRVAVHTRRLERIVARNQACAVKSCFGDVSPGRACVHHPDAAEFFTAMLDDLSTNAAAASTIEICDLHAPFETDLLGAEATADLGPAGVELFAVCFCESCLQSARAAGVDTEAAIRSAQVRLERVIESGPAWTAPLDEVQADDAPLTEYVGHRRAAFASWVASLRRRVRCDLALHTPVHAPTIPAFLTDSSDILVIDVEHASRQDSDDPLMSLGAQQATPGSPRREVQFRQISTHETDAAHLVRTLQSLAETGWGGVSFDHYGRMGEAEFTAVKQAIRYARRTATT